MASTAFAVNAYDHVLSLRMKMPNADSTQTVLLERILTAIEQSRVATSAEINAANVTISGMNVSIQHLTRGLDGLSLRVEDIERRKSELTDLNALEGRLGREISQIKAQGIIDLKRVEDGKLDRGEISPDTIDSVITRLGELETANATLSLTVQQSSNSTTEKLTAMTKVVGEMSEQLQSVNNWKNQVVGWVAGVGITAGLLGWLIGHYHVLIPIVQQIQPSVH